MDMPRSRSTLPAPPAKRQRAAGAAGAAAAAPPAPEPPAPSPPQQQQPAARAPPPLEQVLRSVHAVELLLRRFVRRQLVGLVRRVGGAGNGRDARRLIELVLAVDELKAEVRAAAESHPTVQAALWEAGRAAAARGGGGGSGRGRCNALATAHALEALRQTIEGGGGDDGGDEDDWSGGGEGGGEGGSDDDGECDETLYGDGRMGADESDAQAAARVRAARARHQELDPPFWLMALA
jgi:hypothetical protein